MAEYRTYTLGLQRRFVHYEPMTCADDAEAIAKAQRLPGTHDKELWTGDRLVMRLERKRVPPQLVRGNR
jgi:hypothetical protein